LRTYEEKEKKNNKNLEAKMFELLGKSFTPGQIRCFLNPHPKKRIIWSPEDIASAISLRSVNPKAIYRYLRNVLQIPFPGLSTLRRWASSVVQSRCYIMCACLHETKKEIFERF